MSYKDSYSCACFTTHKASEQTTMLFNYKNMRAHDETGSGPHGTTVGDSCTLPMYPSVHSTFNIHRPKSPICSLLNAPSACVLAAHIINQGIRESTKEPFASSLLRQRRLRWFVDLLRIPSSLPVRRVHCFKPNIHGGERPRGRPKTRWAASIKH